MTNAEIEQGDTLKETQTELIKVLLVEDDPANQWLATSMMEDAGCEVKYATNGVEAVEMAGSNSFDMVFMDLGLPVMNGVEATTIIRNEEIGSGRRVPIVALSALDWEGDKKLCLDSGMDAFLSKPLNREELLEKIKYYAPRTG